MQGRGCAAGETTGWLWQRSSCCCEWPQCILEGTISYCLGGNNVLTLGWPDLLSSYSPPFSSRHAIQCKQNRNRTRSGSLCVSRCYVPSWMTDPDKSAASHLKGQSYSALLCDECDGPDHIHVHTLKDTSPALDDPDQNVAAGPGIEHVHHSCFEVKHLS